MAWTINPTSYCALDSVCLPVVVGNILSETAFEERDFLAASIEAIVTDRYLSVCHCNAVLHRDVVKGLVPTERWEGVT